MFSLDEILTPAQRDDVLATLLALASSFGAPTTAWQEGDPILTTLTADAQKSADLTLVAVEIAKGGFGELLPSDAWADLWAQSRFNETRVPATEAGGLVNATNTSASNYVLAIGEFIVAHTTTGKTYRNQAPITILAGVGLDDILVAADEAGIASNAAPATITTVVSSLVGVGVTNPLAFIGTDKETTPAFVNRSRAKLGSFSPNGPKDAYDYAAKTPRYSPTSTPITRTKTVLTIATGTLTTYLATAAGAPTGGDVAIVQAAFDQYVEPWGAQSIAAAASAVSQGVTYQAWVSGSQLTSAQIEVLIEAALTAWFASLDIGGYVIPPDTGAIYPDVLEQVIGQATPGILRVSVSIPATTVAMTSNQVAQLGAVTGTITRLS
jgi:hypothetical protein